MAQLKELNSIKADKSTLNSMVKDVSYAGNKLTVKFGDGKSNDFTISGSTFDIRGDSGTITPAGNVRIVGQSDTSLDDGMYSSRNIRTTATGDKVVIQLAENLEAKSITMNGGESLSHLNSQGLYFVSATGEVAPSITYQGIDAGGKTISNVAPATREDEAVNLGQLNSALNGIGQNFNQIHNRISKVEDRAYAGIASANAMVPQSSADGNPNTFGIGLGTYGNKKAIVVGYSHNAGKFKLKIGAAANGEKPNFGTGIGYSW